MSRRRDPFTLNLLDWEPPKVAVGYSDDVTGKGALDSRISRLISRALRDAKDEGRGSRAEIARDMSKYLGRPISEAMLNKWASDAADEHRIPLDAFVALIKVSEATELLGFVPSLFHHAVVPERYADLIEIHLLDEHEQEIAARKAALSARWKAKR